MATSYGSVLPTAPQSADVEARQETEDETDATEQAAIGRLSSMSLIAAVTAGGERIHLLFRVVLAGTWNRFTST